MYLRKKKTGGIGHLNKKKKERPQRVVLHKEDKNKRMRGGVGEELVMFKRMKRQPTERGPLVRQEETCPTKQAESCNVTIQKNRKKKQEEKDSQLKQNQNAEKKRRRCPARWEWPGLGVAHKNGEADLHYPRGTKP